MSYYPNCVKIRSVNIRCNLRGTGSRPQTIVLLRELCYYPECYYIEILTLYPNHTQKRRRGLEALQ